jgi:K(+)-stimulated pyrophosphate-energized sodium pump
MQGLTTLAPFFGIVSLIIAWFLYAYVKRQPDGNNKIRELEEMIHDGVMAFLTKEYSILAVYIAAVFIILWLILPAWQTSVAFVSGALCSVIACYTGVTTATLGNSKTAEAANRSGSAKAFNVAYFSGSVMGLAIAGMGLLGVGIWFFIYGNDTGLIRCINGFAFGASSAALFARISGGIYSKAAAFGTDIVCRIEAGIPYDNPRNPGVIASNVGVNVGDIAGMGADIFESFTGSLIAAILIGATLSVSPELIAIFPDLANVIKEDAIKIIRLKYMAIPVLIVISGLLSSIAGVFSIKLFNRTNPAWICRYTIFFAAGIFLIFTASITAGFRMPFGIFWALFSGLLCGIITGLSTGYYTSGDQARYIASRSKTGSATVIIMGLSTGMQSTYIPILCICAAAFTGYMAAGVYGIALCAVGMLAIIGITISIYAFGGIADNAHSIAEMAGLDPETIKTTYRLDASENTTSASGKGFTIASATLTAIAIFIAFTQLIKAANPEIPQFIFDIKDPLVIIGIFIGALVPMIWAALLMTSVGRASLSIVEEIRRQFTEIPGLLEGNIGVKGDPQICISLTAASALKEMMAPGLVAIITPVAVGFLLGPIALGGTIIGAIVMGTFLAIFMSNAGSAWENAKKYIEEGNVGGKGSDNHKATVVGDTVGGLFKDTSAPAINILIKLMAVVSLVLAPILPSAGLFQ